MSLTIYGIPASRAVRPLWAATELGLDFKHVNLAYQGGGTRTPEFLAINPNGHVPVVVDQRSPEQGGEMVIWESMACALYIARHHGQPDGKSITPANPVEDAEALRWSFWAVTETESDALTVLMHRMVMPADRRKPELAEAAERRLAVPFRVIEQQLQRQQLRDAQFLAASRFTVADLCVASVLNWARPARGLMESHPLTHDWIVRCIERPAHQAVKSMGRAA
jgi:glutathione S-transferase